MADRVRRAAGGDAGAARGDRELQPRHCWVVDAPGHPGRYAGVLVEWRRRPEGWEGRVVYAIPEPGGRFARVVERWVAAAHLCSA
jgi:hypothetical protein